MISFAKGSTLKKSMTIGALALIMPMTMISAGHAFPAMTSPALSTAVNAAPNSDVTKVYWRGRGWGWRGGWGWGGVGAGIAAGALIGGAIAANSYPYGYGYGPGYYYAPPPTYYAPAPAYGGGDAVAYCMQRYRSYDPRSGTYLNYDGNRYPCP